MTTITNIIVAAIGKILAAAIAAVIALYLTPAPAHAFMGLGWAEDAAKEELALTACTKRLHPGLTGEAFDKAKAKVRTDMDMARALLGEDIKPGDYCAAVTALRNQMKK